MFVKNILRTLERRWFTVEVRFEYLAQIQLRKIRLLQKGFLAEPKGSYQRVGRVINWIDVGIVLQQLPHQTICMLGLDLVYKQDFIEQIDLAFGQVGLLKVQDLCFVW